MDITSSQRVALGAREPGVVVTGTYCHAPIRGVVEGVRRHTINHRVWEFRVRLSEPITLAGRERDGIVLVCTDFHGDALPADVWGAPYDHLAAVD